MFFKLLIFTWSSFAFSHSYQLIDFLEGQRTLLPQSEIENRIELYQRVDFQRLTCFENRGLFTPYLLSEGESSLVVTGKETRKTKKVLEYLKKKSRVAKQLIERLQKSPHKVYIKETTGNSFFNLRVFDQYEHNNAYAVTILEKLSLNMEDDRVPLRKLGGGSVVNWNPTRAGSLKLQAITLAHELYHAYDASRGMLDYRLVTGAGLERTAVTEYRGVYFENLVRKDFGLKPRLKYSENSEGSLKNLWIDRPCLKE